jgi:hypothetical protein
MDRFLYAIDGLHDAILREAAVVSRGYVAADRRMIGDANPSDARLFFQSQSRDFAAVEIFCESLLTMSFEPNIVLEASGVVTADEVTLYLEEAGFGERSRVVAKRMSYRMLGPSSLGDGPRFVSSILPPGAE